MVNLLDALPCFFNSSLKFRMEILWPVGSWFVWVLAGLLLGSCLRALQGSLTVPFPRSKHFLFCYSLSGEKKPTDCFANPLWSTDFFAYCT